MHPGIVLYSAVSNEVPEEPVISPVSRHIFEKRIVVKFIQQNGSDPINGEPLTEDDLIEIKGEIGRTGRVEAHGLVYSI